MSMCVKIRGPAWELALHRCSARRSAVASLIMADTHHAQGPGKSVLGIGQRIVSIMVEMVETRLRLAVVELEEEKANLFQLLLMLGLTMLFAAFGLMSLMVLIIWRLIRNIA